MMTVTRTKQALFLIAVSCLASDCSIATRQPVASPVMKQETIRGTSIRYVDQGRGTTVLFVHGGSSDHRIWEAQRAVIAKDYRFIAIDQRYFGTAPWPDDGSQFTLATHVADLTEFIRATQRAPVYLVGQSYGAVVVLALTIEHPELVRAIFINEPPLTTAVEDSAAAAILRREALALPAIASTAAAGDTVGAARAFYDWLNGTPGAFDLLSREAQLVRVENGRTLSKQLTPSARASITCAQLGQISVPVSITTGESTRDYFRLVVQAVHRCIRAARLTVIPGAQHGAQGQAPDIFNRTLLAFLAENRTR